MKNMFLFLTVCILFISCKPKMQVYETAFDHVTIDTLLKQKMSVRAILIDETKLWYAADNSRFGFYNFKTGEKAEKQIVNDSPKLEFRSIAQTPKFIFIASIGNPAFIYKINKSDLSYEKVYTEVHEKVFYDSMNFWNENEGIAIGDPTENCLSILITRDAGKTWKKLSCHNLPTVADGEAAFAASNTNICIKGSKTWIVSGGKKSRVFYSADKGITWKVFETPIVQGEAMTGIFTVDFYDENNGFIAGGNYETPFVKTQNKALTKDGGKTWKLMAENEAFGYASCVQFISNPNWKEQLVSVGPSGLYYSAYNGIAWQRFDWDKDLYTIRFLNSHTAFAAGKDKIIRIEFQK
jgi:photosystem II stability/assembly factor-like uncharacterized protein